MNDITGYQPKGEPIANPKPPSGGSSIMNHTEAPIADGYYWAKGKSNTWHVVYVEGEWAKLVGDSECWPLSDFTFGPRIEEPK